MFCKCGCGMETRVLEYSNRTRGEVRGAYRNFIQGHASRMRSRDSAGNKRCSSCVEWKNEATEFYRRNKSRTLSICKECSRSKLREWSLKNTKRKRQAQNERMRRIRNENREHYRNVRRQYSQRLRDEMIAAYGNKCSCCGETVKAFLTLEHVNDDGAEHRRILKTGGGDGILRDLRRRGWPKDGYTTLCWNCNCGRRINGGTCPHKDSSAVTLAPWS